jgi:hypothetical protein
MNQKFDHILDECIRALKAGDSIDACLQRYPQYADALRPLLKMAAACMDIEKPEVTIQAVRASEQMMLAAFHEKKAAQPVSKAILSRYTQREQVGNNQNQTNGIRKEKLPMSAKLKLLIAGLLVTIFVASSGVIVASANSLPSDTLYPVKEAVQRVQLLFAFNENGRQRVEQRIYDDYLRDIKQVIAEGREVAIKFEGTVEEIGENYLVVEGIRVELTDQLYNPELLRVGDEVEVYAQVQSDGSVVATQIYLIDFDIDDDDDDDMNDDDDDDMDDDDDDDMDDDDDDDMDDDDDDDMDDDDDDDMDDDDDDDMDDDDDDDMDDDDDDDMDDDDDDDMDDDDDDDDDDDMDDDDDDDDD